MSSPRETLLPPSATPLLRRTAAACADAEDLPVEVLRTLHNPNTCPAAVLPWLAWAWRVEEWSDGWSTAQKRRAVRESLLLHRRKGTWWAVRRTIALHGFVVDRILVNPHRVKYDATIRLMGWNMLGGYAGAFIWRVVLKSKRVSAEQKRMLWRALVEVAPARAKLVGIHYKAARIKYDGTVRLDGSYTLGAEYA